MLTWEEAYRIGHAEMDSEHLILFALLNQIDINIDNDLGGACVDDVLGALNSYIGYHFAHEEALMQSYNYPGLEEHVALHRAFSEKVKAFKGGTDRNQAALKVRGLVLDWLLDHILEVDVDYARFITRKS